MSRITILGLFAAAFGCLAGCDKKPAPSTEFKGGHDHSDHDRKDAQIEDIKLPGGEYHAGLTAHLSEKADKNELDVFFETHDKKAFPIPLTAKVTARVTRPGDDKAYDLEFKPAEKDERKNDPADKCSRFSADAPWMKPEDKLSVVLTVEIDKKIHRCTFVDFNPKKFAHAHE